MFGALDISASGLVAQRERITAVAANLALRDAAVDPKADPDLFRRRVPILAPGDPSSGRAEGVHLADLHYDRGAFRKVLDPGHPYADASGYVSYPDIDPAVEMINALEASRAYEANVTAAEATKSMIQSSLRILA